MGTTNPYNIYGTEFFYWTPDMPLLAFEMGHRIAQWYLANPHYINMCAWRNENFHSLLPLTFAYIMQQKLYRNILYTNWTNRFQADKSLKLERIDKQNWIMKIPEMKRYREQFMSIKDDHAATLHRQAYTIDQGRPMYLGIFTNSYKLLDHNIKDLV